MSESNLSVGRSPEVSDSEIIKAGETLLEDGRRVTGFALRKGVGGRGDPKRLFKVWNAHLSLNHESHDATDRALPFVLNEHLEEATCSGIVNLATN
ncbi:MAG: colicin import membrane protein [Oleiphilaceae bacterium]|jgi:colicin import membrane protein